MASGARITVKDTDKGFDSMVRGIETLLKQPYIKIGVIGQASHGSGLTVVDVATFHEFGTETLPQRSFIRSTVDDNLNYIQNKQSDIIKKTLFEGADFEREAGRLGLELQAKIQQKIKNRIPPPNAESTIRAKGSDVPLIDTGQLFRSITFEVGKR